MNLDRAQMMAVDLMTYHGLNGWTFGFDGARWRHGLCSYRRKRITISKALTELNTEDTVLDTILHEVAHALVPRGSGHGPVWKQRAVAIGCNGKRCADTNTVKAPAPFEGKCPSCGYTTKAYRRRNTACASCCKAYNKGVYSALYRFVWRRADVIQTTP